MSKRAPAHFRLGGIAAVQSWLPLAGGLAFATGLILAPLMSVSAEDAASAPPPSSVTLGVATWGGAYGQSQDIAYFAPFTKETGVKINSETYDGTLAAIKAKIGGGNSPFDIVDLSSGVLDALCHDGLLETLESSMLGAAPGGQSVDDDFIAGGITPCGVASVAWSTAIAFDRQAFGKAQPTKIADLLDIQHFPGKRALPDGPRYTLELALLADGVQPDDVYRELGTPEGADRAFKALDKIKANIVWWDKPQDAIAALTDKKAVMAAGYSGRIFRATIGARQRLEVLWDGQIYDLDLWAIPKAAANKDDAKRFIAFATAPARMAAQAELIAYGPMRKSAITLVGKNPTIDIEMKSYLPTAPDNFHKALKFDETWWDGHSEELGKRFEAWREQASTAEGGQTGSVPAPAQ